MILAQVTSSANATVPSLPGPPPGIYYVVENPWPLAVVLVVFAIPAYALLNARRHFRLAPIATACLIIGAIGVVLAAGLVKTQREVLRERTKELVDLAVTAKTTALGQMLMESADVSAFGGVIPTPKGREAILDAVRSSMGDTYQVEEHSISAVQAHLDGQNVARTQVRVWAKPRKELRLYDAPIGGWFRLDWQRDPLREGGYGPWKVSRITVLQMDTLGVNPQNN